MGKPISKRALIRVVSFSLAAAVLLCCAGILGYNFVSRYKNSIEYTYQSALNQFSDHLTDLKNTLTKGIYANTAVGRNEIYTKIIVSSEQAKDCLSSLPVTLRHEESIQKYLSHTGDVAAYLQKKYISGKTLSEEDENMLLELREYCKDLADTAEDMAAFYNNNGIFLGEELAPGGNLSSLENAVQEYELDGSFRNMSSEFTNYPTLIYDGPFSDHMLRQTAQMTLHTETFDENEARLNAARFLNCEEENLYLASKTDGNVPMYFFSSSDNSTLISVTQQGGFIDSCHISRDVSEEKLDYKHALERARTFLKEKKYDDMQESYGFIADGVANFNFAYTKDGVTCYSDLIKVGVAMDTGEVVSFSATGYIMNHKQRDIKEPALSLGQALSNLSSHLSVVSEGTALIPTGGNSEVLCYEFLCKGEEDDDVLVYINAQTGMEENIYIIIESDNGYLTI